MLCDENRSLHKQQSAQDERVVSLKTHLLAGSSVLIEMEIPASWADMLDKTESGDSGTETQNSSSVSPLRDLM